MTTVTIKVIKNNTKENITCSISKFQDGQFRSLNITGSLTECEGFYSREGINYDKEIVQVDCATTVLITDQTVADAVYERCAQIFADRRISGDKNPAVDLQIEANSVNITDTNILISKVTKIYVNPNTTLSNTSDSILNSLNNLKAYSASKSTIISNSISNSLQSAKPQLNAAMKGLNSLANSVKHSVKTYL